ncbi:MAG: hypothetical protein ABII12_12165 [Planctomycetota bacterium]
MPTGGSFSYTGSWKTDDLSLENITYTTATDAGAGILSHVIQRREATLTTGGTCVGYGSWSDKATDPGSPWTDSGLADEKCYQYRLWIRDLVSNELVYDPGTELKVDTRDAYLIATAVDTDPSDDPEGILDPNGTDEEIVLIKAYDRGDNVRTASTREINVVLTCNDPPCFGAPGAATFTECSWGACSGVSATGNLSGGEAWIKVKAIATTTNVLIVTADTSPAGQTTKISGRDQVASIILATDPGTVGVLVDVVDPVVATGTTGIVVNPAWNNAGNKVAYLREEGGNWNIYTKEYSGGSWINETQITGNGMNVLQSSRITWRQDDAMIIFSSADGNDSELYAVASGGGDNAKTLATLAGENKKLSKNKRRWGNPHWASSGCGTERMLTTAKSLNPADPSKPGGAKIVVFSGAKNAAGLYEEDTSTLEDVINLNGATAYWLFALAPRWSPDCSKFTFAYFDWTGFYVTGAKVGIYVMDMSSWPAGGAVTSLADSRITTVHQCDTISCTDGAAYYPSFSADGNMVSYMKESTGAMPDFSKLLGSDPDIANTFFNGKNFDNYLRHLSYLTVEQEIGNSANNELFLEQCFGGGCPNDGNGNAFMYVTQNYGGSGSSLSMLTLDSESIIKTNGGLLFYEGTVVAVFPAGSIGTVSETVKIQDAPPGATPACAAGDTCEDILVSTGEAREFFPDGVFFNKDVLLIFHYDDANDDGLVDGDGYDENKLYVYFWCNDPNTIGCSPMDSWIKLDGTIDKDNNTITVATDHFSIYDVKALMKGRVAPAVAPVLKLTNPHAYPNPVRSGQTVKFAVDNDDHNLAAGTGSTVTIEIYDIRAKRVRTLTRAIAAGEVLNTAERAGTATFLEWNVTNAGGRRLASGVYLYYMVVKNSLGTVTLKGKIAVID